MIRSAFGIYHPIHKLLLLFSDVAGIVLAFYAASQIRLGITPAFDSVEFFGISLIILSSLFVGGAYTSGFLTSRPKLPLNTFFVILASALPCTLFIYFLGPERFNTLLGRGVFPVAILMLGVLLVFTRYLLNRWLRTPDAKKRVLFLGDQIQNQQINRLLDTSQIPLSIAHSEQLTKENLPDHQPDAIVICPEHNPAQDEQQLLVNLRLAGTPIFSLSDFFESFMLLVPVEYVNNDWFIRAEGFTMVHSAVTTRIKNALDKLAALSLLIVTSPLLLLSILMIKISSRGPALFSQSRVGINGKHFTLYKLRTMQINAESGGAQWTEANDPRITTVGRFLRKTRIDEIPQCWNILRGEMSFIGPRPERPEFTSLLASEIPYYDLRHVIKPGLTGWAQVNYHYGASQEDALRKLQYDLYYIKNYSLLLDLNILLRTILVTLRRGGR